MGFGGPVWHASIAWLANQRPKTKVLRNIADELLKAVGTPDQQWEELRPRAFHLRRRLTALEQTYTGVAQDIRGTREAKWRAVRMGEWLQRIPPDLLREELSGAC